MAQDQDVEKYPALTSLKRPESARDGPVPFLGNSRLQACWDVQSIRWTPLCDELRSYLNPEDLQGAYFFCFIFYFMIIKLRFGFGHTRRRTMGACVESG